MSVDNIKNDISKSLGALSGISKKRNDSVNSEDQTDHINHKFQALKNNAKKKNLKNVTFGLYEYQNQELKKLSKKYGLNKNEFLREALDIIIDALKENDNS